MNTPTSAEGRLDFRNHTLGFPHLYTARLVSLSYPSEQSCNSLHVWKNNEVERFNVLMHLFNKDSNLDTCVVEL